jgi:hypothetical protein
MHLPTAAVTVVRRDSHIKQIYAALRCFMTDLWEHAGGECAASTDFELQFKLDDVTASGHQYRTQPRCLHLVGGRGARICLVHSPKGDMFFEDNPQVRERGHGCWSRVLCRAVSCCVGCQTLRAEQQQEQKSRRQLPAFCAQRFGARCCFMLLLLAGYGHTAALGP